MDLRETICEDGRLMEMTQNHVQHETLVLAEPNLRGSVPTESYIHTEKMVIIDVAKLVELYRNNQLNVLKPV
jgi:hypothetical protein